MFGRIVALRDIADQVAAEEDMARSEAQYRLIAENALDVVLRTEATGVITWASPSVSQVLGWQPAEVVGRSQATLVHPDDLAMARDEQRQALARGHERGAAEVRYRTSTGGWRWVRASGTAVRDADGRLLGGIDTLRDIDAEVETRRRLAFEVDHDSLTGLSTRGLLLRRLAENRALGGWSELALLCVGVDMLHEINDAYTHSTGDRVVSAIAERLAAAVGDRDRIGRSSGNEFLVVVVDPPTGSGLLDIVTILQDAVNGPVTMGAYDVSVTVSIGIAIDSGDGHTEELVRDATTAMHRAKSQGGNRWEFADRQLAEDARQRMLIQTGLRDALGSGRIQAWFQPIVALADGQVRGYESLARWVRDDGTIVPPDEFIPVAERTNLIVELDRDVLTQALEFARKLPADVHVAVNLSAAAMSAPDLVATVTDALATSGVSADRLHLEVTETALPRVTDSVLVGMRALIERGIAWWVDDFGTGYSSLSHLRDMPIQGLKLDRSFTSGITDADPTRLRLAQGLIGLANGLGLATVAEGVETREEAEILTAQGWELAQGWLYGKPVPASELLG